LLYENITIAHTGMMADVLVTQLQAAVQQLQTVISPDGPSNSVESVAQVSRCAQALLQHVAELQQGLENK
jgi:hypothetical protein